MKTPNLHMPHIGHHDGDEPEHEAHHKSALQRSKQVEGLINKAFIAIVVLLGVVLAYGLFHTQGAPAYFH